MSKKKNKKPSASSNTRSDGWTNIYSGQGIKGIDRKTGAKFSGAQRFTEQELSDLYRGDGLARRTVDLPCGEMTKKWFSVYGDTDGDITKYLKGIRAKQKVTSGLRWAKLYGGSLGVLLINDGGQLEDPVNEKNIKSIESLEIYERYRVTWSSANLYEDTNNPKYGQVETYNVSPISCGVAAEPFTVHESRTLFFDGMTVDSKTRQENNGWGDSIFNSIFSQLEDLVGSYHSSRNIIDDFIQTILKIDNLQELIAAGQEELIKKRLNIIDIGRHVMNTIMIDSREDYSKVASSIAGLSDILQKFAEMYSAVTEIPMTLLMGTSSNGFNSKDEGSLTKWYDKIKQDQEDDLEPIIERLVYLSMLAKEGPTNGTLLKDWSVKFNPLQQMTEEQTVSMRNKQAQTDKIYIEQGVVDPAEVAVSRFGGTEYSIDTTIDTTIDRDTLSPQKKSVEEPEEPEEEEDDDK